MSFVRPLGRRTRRTPRIRRGGTGRIIASRFPRVSTYIRWCPSRAPPMHLVASQPRVYPSSKSMHRSGRWCLHRKGRLQSGGVGPNLTFSTNTKPHKINGLVSHWLSVVKFDPIGSLAGLTTQTAPDRSSLRAPPSSVRPPLRPALEARPSSTRPSRRRGDYSIARYSTNG